MAQDSSSVFGNIDSLLGDRYTREAWLAPAFLSILPFFLLLFSWVTDLQQTFTGLVSLFAVFGVVRWISHISRVIGTDMDIHLYHHWGGMPTTTLLRAKPEDAICGGDPRLKRYFPEPGLRLQIYTQYKIAMEAMHLTPRDLPTTEDEAVAIGEGHHKDWAALDKLYEPMVAWLRENSRDNALLFEENISYGFQKNFYALKPFALRCGYVALVIQITAIYETSWRMTAGRPSDITLAAVTTGVVAFLYGVHRFVDEEGVKLQAFTYARQLLHTAYKSKSDAKPNAAAPAKAGDGG